MDHLPQQDTEHIHVPFVAEPRRYTPDDFFSLPKSVGCSVTGLLQSGPGQLPEDKAPGFLQSWLFFALLAQVLNEDVDSGQFLHHRHGSKEVNTEDLVTLFEQSPQIASKAKRRPSIISEGPDRYHRVRASLALDEARIFVLAWCSDNDHEQDLGCELDSPAEFPPQDGNSLFRAKHPEICLSFGILGETLDRFRARHRPWPRLRNEAEPYGSWQDRVTDQRSWGFSKLLRQRMMKMGWCPHEVRRISVTAGDLSSTYYISSFQPAKLLDHSTCNAQKCQLDPWHAHDQHTSQCPFRDNNSGCVIPDDEELIRIVAAGNIPLLKFDNKENLSLTKYVLERACSDSDDGLIEPTDQPRFVAISHAWSDGLGPSGGAGISRCQLIRLRDTLKKDPDTKDLPFWIDSQCVPRQPEAKNKAIQMMGQVYSVAYTVLVLDSSLRATSSFPETLEAIVRINTGIWSTRMWTLPEGVRARNLHFDFKDGLLSANDLRRRYDNAKQNPLHREHHVYKAGWLFSPYIFSMRNKIDDLHSTPKKRNGAAKHEQVAHIWQAMQWRQASRVEDETLCLARLLDIDPLPLLRIEAANNAEIAEKRMLEFLDLLDQHLGIPPGMIFLPGPKLQIRGLAWAPSSWMCKCSRDLAGPLFVSEQRLSFLTRNGLHVQYPGIQLHPGRKPLGPRFWIPTERNLTKWYRVEYIKGLDSESDDCWPAIWESACSGNELPAIIRSRFDQHDEPELALMVKGVGLRKEEVYAASGVQSAPGREDVRWARSLCRLRIQWETDHAVAAKLTEDFRYNIDLMTWGETLHEDQRWVVDGRLD
jgi:hypothetical protein